MKKTLFEIGKSIKTAFFKRSDSQLFEKNASISLDTGKPEIAKTNTPRIIIEKNRHSTRANVQVNERLEKCSGFIVKKKRYPNCTLILVSEDSSNILTKFVRVERNSKEKISVFNAYLDNVKVGDNVQVIGFNRDNSEYEPLGWINGITVIMPKQLKLEEVFCDNSQLGAKTVDSIYTLEEKLTKEDRVDVARFYKSLIAYKSSPKDYKFQFDAELEQQVINEFKKSVEFDSRIDPALKIQKREELEKREAHLKETKNALRNFMKNKEYEIYGMDRRDELQSSIIMQERAIAQFKIDYDVW